jgi:hypothetical protein
MTDPRDTPPLDGADRDLVALLRDDRTAASPGEARARVAAKVAALAVLGGSGLVGVRPAASLLPRVTGWLGAKGLAVATFVVGAGSGAGLHAMLAKPAPPVIVYRDRVPSSVPARPVTETSPSASEPAEQVVTRAPAREVSSDRSGPAPSAPTGAGTQLHAERVLLDEARVALNRGDADATLGLLERHTRAFPHPKLAEEREALRVEALVKAGRYDEARVAATAFGAAYPDSMLSGAVKGALSTIP